MSFARKGLKTSLLRFMFLYLSEITFLENLKVQNRLVEDRCVKNIASNASIWKLLFFPSVDYKCDLPYCASFTRILNSPRDNIILTTNNRCKKLCIKWQIKNFINKTLCIKGVVLKIRAHCSVWRNKYCAEVVKVTRASFLMAYWPLDCSLKQHV